MIEHLNNKNFSDKIENLNKISLIKFTALWCAPCKALAPIFEEVSKEIKEANFFEVEVDKEQELSTKFDIMSVPTIVFIKNNKEILRLNGLQRKQYLKETILSNL